MSRCCSRGVYGVLQVLLGHLGCHRTYDALAMGSLEYAIVLPATCWLSVKMASHCNWLPVFSCAWPGSENVPHLIDLNIASQAAALFHQPVSHILILFCEREATHARTRRQCSPLRACALQRAVQP